jgi:hypothetical protein
MAPGLAAAACEKNAFWFRHDSSPEGKKFNLCLILAAWSQYLMRFACGGSLESWRQDDQSQCCSQIGSIKYAIIAAEDIGRMQ